MLCPYCNKFAANDTSGEPEIDIQCESGQVTGTVRIVLTSECCSAELKEANFDVEMDLTEDILDALVAKAKELKLPELKREDIDLEDETKRKVMVEGKMEEKITSFSIEDSSGEITDRSETTKTRTLKSGRVVVRQIPYRYQRRFYGASINFTVNVEYPYKKRLLTVEVPADWKDEVQASGMDELV